MSGPRIVCVCCNKPLRSLRWLPFCRTHGVLVSDEAAVQLNRERAARSRRKAKAAEEATKLERLKGGVW